MQPLQDLPDLQDVITGTRSREDAEAVEIRPNTRDLGVSASQRARDQILQFPQILKVLQIPHIRQIPHILQPLDTPTPRAGARPFRRLNE